MLVGDSGVGKSGLALRMATGQFEVTGSLLTVPVRVAAQLQDELNGPESWIVPIETDGPKLPVRQPRAARRRYAARPQKVGHREPLEAVHRHQTRLTHATTGAN